MLCPLGLMLSVTVYHGFTLQYKPTITIAKFSTGDGAVFIYFLISMRAGENSLGTSLGFGFGGLGNTFSAVPLIS